MNIFKRIKRQVKQKHHRSKAIPLVIGITILVGLPTGNIRVLAQAQSPDGALSPLQDIELNLPEINGFLPSQNSEVARGPVRIDGRYLFTVTEVAVNEASDQKTELTPIESRIRTIENRITGIVRSDFDVNSLQVFTETDPESNQPVIYAAYGTGRDPQTTEIVTVTSLDAKLNGSKEPEDLAQEWAQSIQNSIIRAKQEREPAFLQQQALVAGGIVVAIGISSLLVTYFQRRLQHERHSLDNQYRTDTQRLTANSNTESGDAVMTALLQQQMATRQRLNVNDIQRRLAQVGQIAVWGGGIFVGLGLFPQTRWLQPIIINIVRIPARLLAVGFGTYVMVRLSAVLIDRLFWVVQNSTSFGEGTSQRLTLRFSTFSRVVKTSIGVILVGTGVITALAAIGIEVGPLLAGAGIVGLGISFASQSLIKDVINGFFILLEDQYGVGDVIIVGDVAGLVENLNLRITQLRNEEGRLITIPNSAITIVQNLSKEWSRVDLMITVAHEANIDEALELIEGVAKEMSHDRPWKDLILEPPSLLGVDKIDHSGLSIRLWIKTQPLKQWDVAREYRRRLKYAIDEAKLPIGVPLQSLIFNNKLDLRGELKAAALNRNGQYDPRDLKMAQRQEDEN